MAGEAGKKNLELRPIGNPVNPGWVIFLIGAAPGFLRGKGRKT
jgi:hypothetical protein